MREIKFRAFENGVMYNELSFIGMGEHPAVMSSNPDKPLIRPILMQYTGLKDKNGKEIYEGDIVNHEKWVSIGKYEPVIGVIEYRPPLFVCRCEGDWIGSNAELNSMAEVIGNIHENPELL